MAVQSSACDSSGGGHQINKVKPSSPEDKQMGRLKDGLIRGVVFRREAWYMLRQKALQCRQGEQGATCRDVAIDAF